MVAEPNSMTADTKSFDLRGTSLDQLLGNTPSAAEEAAKRQVAEALDRVKELFDGKERHKWSPYRDVIDREGFTPEQKHAISLQCINHFAEIALKGDARNSGSDAWRWAAVIAEQFMEGHLGTPEARDMRDDIAPKLLAIRDHKGYKYFDPIGLVAAMATASETPADQCPHAQKWLELAREASRHPLRPFTLALEYMPAHPQAAPFAGFVMSHAPLPAGLPRQKDVEDVLTYSSAAADYYLVASPDCRTNHLGGPLQALAARVVLVFPEWIENKPNMADPLAKTLRVFGHVAAVDSNFASQDLRERIAAGFSELVKKVGQASPAKAHQLIAEHHFRHTPLGSPIQEARKHLVAVLPPRPAKQPKPAEPQ